MCRQGEAVLAEQAARASAIFSPSLQAAFNVVKGFVLARTDGSDAAF